MMNYENNNVRPLLISNGDSNYGKSHLEKMSGAVSNIILAEETKTLHRMSEAITSIAKAFDACAACAEQIKAFDFSPNFVIVPNKVFIQLHRNQNIINRLKRKYGLHTRSST